MNRPIKFRAWTGRVMQPNPIYEVERFPYLNDLLATRDFVLLQYTGLKDRMGVEIYEGDIVRESDDLWRCIYLDNGACFAFQELEEAGDFLNKAVHVAQFEVIGNIYENKDLLK